MPTTNYLLLAFGFPSQTFNELTHKLIEMMATNHRISNCLRFLFRFSVCVFVRRLSFALTSIPDDWNEFAPTQIISIIYGDIHIHSMSISKVNHTAIEVESTKRMYLGFVVGTRPHQTQTPIEAITVYMYFPLYWCWYTVQSHAHTQPLSCCNSYVYCILDGVQRTHERVRR